jgi:asparagine synthase (glutamine-hydrolysing)
MGVSKRPKQGFTVPIAHWLTTALKPWANDILDPLQIEKDGFFDAREVRRLWREHQERKINHGKKLWTIIVFQHWLHSVWSEWNSIKIH